MTFKSFQYRAFKSSLNSMGFIGMGNIQYVYIAKAISRSHTHTHTHTQIPTCVPSLHRKAWCGMWLWLSSRSWHSWWWLCHPAPPMARWGWSGRKHRAAWRHTPRHAPEGIRSLGSREGKIRVRSGQIKVSIFLVLVWSQAVSALLEPFVHGWLS